MRARLKSAVHPPDTRLERAEMLAKEICIYFALTRHYAAYISQIFRTEMDPIASPEPRPSTERREIVVSYSCLNMRGIRSRGKPSVTMSRATFLYRHSINCCATKKLP